MHQAAAWLRDQPPLHLAALLVAAYVALQLALLVASEVSRWGKVHVGTRHVPSAPGANWLLGHVFQLTSSCAWEKMYEWVGANPPLIKFRIFHRIGIVVGDPRGLKRIFQVRPAAQPSLCAHTASHPAAASHASLPHPSPHYPVPQTRYKVYEKDLDFSYKPFLSILGSGLVTANGAHWQKQRILMAPALRVDMLDAILPIAKRATDRLAVKLEAHRGSGQPIDMEDEFRLLTLQVIGEAILSLPHEECDRVFPALYLPVMEESNRRVLQPWRYLYPTTVLRYNSNVRQLNAYIVAIITARRVARSAAAAAAGDPKQQQQEVPGDILDRILQSIEERGEKWGPALETQLCYEIKTFLLAGHETSAAMLTWSLYELSQAPAAMAQVKAEAVTALGPADAQNAAPPPRSAVDSMLWTLSCLKESLRKYSVVPVVTRNMNADDELCGFHLPAGSWVICHLQRVHHLYKDPLRWLPQRFMPGGEYDQFDDDIRPYMFVPFIQGPRNCLGQYFALLEARVVLASLCQRFTFMAVDPQAQGETHPTVIPVGPVKGMRMVVS